MWCVLCPVYLGPLAHRQLAAHGVSLGGYSSQGKTFDINCKIGVSVPASVEDGVRGRRVALFVL